MRKIAECGTRSGYNRHRKLGEQACQPCTKANSANSLNFYKNNTERSKQHNVNYYNRNKDKISEKHKNYYKNNKEEVLSRHKKYYSENQDVYRRAKHRRRAKERNNGFEKYTLVQVLEMYGTTCHICNKEIDMQAPRGVGIDGWQMGLHIDHIVPISKGGTDTISNVRPSHGICNITKSARTIEEKVC